MQSIHEQLGKPAIEIVALTYFEINLEHWKSTSAAFRYLGF